MYTTSIIKAELMYDVLEKVNMYDVRFVVLNGDEVIAERRLSFAKETPSDAIKAELAKYAEALYNDHEIQKKDAEEMAELEKANETLKELTN
jgi:hypothetical protein